MSDAFTPTAICNLALDAAGVDFFLGNIEEGTRPAQVCLRSYGDCLKQLLRCAGWGFARKQTNLLLLADATGQTANVGSVVPGTWIYEYALPVDSAFIRYIPWYPFLTPPVPVGNIVPPDSSSPIVDNLQTLPFAGQRVVPARFLVTSDQNYIPDGAANSTPGISPIGRTVILTNVPQAQVIYTYEALYPNVWDYQFRAAMVAYLASEIAMPLATDKKFGLTLRDRNIAIAQEKIRNARVTDGREGWHVTGDIPDWMRTRVVGGATDGWNGGWGLGLLGDYNCAYDSIAFGGNSSAY